MGKEFTSEREAWDFYRTKAGEKEASQNVEFFRKIFPAGHRNSIRALLRAFAEMGEAERKEFFRKKHYAYLRSVHPRAFGFIMRHGCNYSPMIMTEPPTWGEPLWAHCFLNSLHLMYICNLRARPTPIVYVEGITIGAAAYPMLHAWNAYGAQGRKALDWTLYATCCWNRYLGIVFTQSEYERIRQRMAPNKGDTVRSMFHKKTFPKLEPLLTEILASRV